MKLKRQIAIILSVLLVLSFAGCGEKNNIEKTNSVGGGDTLFEETLEITVMMPLSSNFPERSVVEDEMERVTNVKANYIKPTSSSYNEKLNVTLASRNLPDLIYISDDYIAPWIEQGALLPLEEYLESDGKNIKSVFTENEFKKMKNPEDGKIYGIPHVNRLKGQFTLGIRYDWLEKLGLDIPNTIDEWKTVLTAFRDNAKALGQESVIPWAGPLTPFYDMYGVMSSGVEEAWSLDENGDIISTYEHPNYIKVLKTLREFYQEGLIDPEYIVRNKKTTTIYELFNTGKSGAGMVYNTRLREITEILRTSNENALFGYALPIESEDGSRRILGRAAFGNKGAITVSAKDKAADIMKYMDWMFSEEGKRLLNCGIEGVHHDMVDGKPILLEPYNQGWVEARLQGLVPNHIAFERDLEVYDQALYYGKSVDELNEFERLTYDGYQYNDEYCYEPILKLNPPENAEYGVEVYSFLKEKEAKAIMGEITIEEFMQELEKAKKDGLDKMTEGMRRYYNVVK